MRPLARLALAAVLAAAVPILSACESLDTFDIFDNKKKLAGERKPVFPEGVPGVATGVPPELVKGYHEPEGGTPDPAKAAAQAAAEPVAKPKPKSKPAPQRTASKPAPQPQAPADPYAAAPTRAPASQPAPQPAPQATAPWPAVQPQAAWPGAPGAVAR
ncbi:MAG TPA: hypothetical protein VLJ17_04655 [Xanthobacteraceae bacterium]|nr:hypothetical protein [Xanthobacteraceae bacterium]